MKLKKKIMKREQKETNKSSRRKTRLPDSPLNEGAAESFKEVQPNGFKDNPRSSIEAAVTDPDVADSEGGE